MNTNVKKNVVPFLVSATIVVITFLFFNNLESFFINLLSSIVTYPNTYAFISFLVLASDIVLPVPSSVVMYMNGYVLGSIGGVVISLISLLVGAVVGYYIGKLTSFGLKAKSDERANSILSKYGALAILMSRGIPIVSESICVVCGYNKVAFRQYIFFNLVGYVPLCILYAICGSLGYDKNIFLISFGCSVLISVALWLFGKKLLKTKLISDEC